MNTYLGFGETIGFKNKMFTNGKKKSYYFRKKIIDSNKRYASDSNSFAIFTIFSRLSLEKFFLSNLSCNQVF